VKTWIGVDMEGVAGVCHPEVLSSEGYGYAAACALMTGEANAGVRGAFAGGATEVIVNDGHGKMLNLNPADLDPRATLLQGQKTWSAVEGAGPDLHVDVALFVGYHARAGHPRGTISHTYTDRIISSRLNGKLIGETGIHAAVLGSWGVPVGLVAGDDTLADEIDEWIPWAQHVVVKQAFGRHSAASVHPSVAAERISEGSANAVRRAVAGELRPLLLSGPVEMELHYRLPIQADYGASVPGVERFGDSGIRISGSDAVEVFRAFLCGVRLTTLVP
jgi:D-amino peptidase